MLNGRKTELSATELFLGLTCFFVGGDIPKYSPILTFPRRHRTCLLNVLCTFNLRPVPTGQESHTFTIKRLIGVLAGTYNGHQK